MYLLSAWGGEVRRGPYACNIPRGGTEKEFTYQHGIPPFMWAVSLGQDMDQGQEADRLPLCTFLM